MRARPRSAGWTPRRPLRAGLIRAIAVAGLLLVAWLAAATTASAHSQLERTDPADGSQVAVLPEAITLTFNQNVLGLGDLVEVTGPDGNAADGKPSVVDNQVIQAIGAGAPAGAYTVLWRVTSADGHPISGRFTFTAAAGSSGTAAGAATADGGQAAADGDQAAAAATVAGGDSAATGSIDSAMLWLLAGCGVVVVAGVVIAARRPGHRPVKDEVTAGASAGGSPPV